MCGSRNSYSTYSKVSLYPFIMGAAKFRLNQASCGVEINSLEEFQQILLIFGETSYLFPGFCYMRMLVVSGSV